MLHRARVLIPIAAAVVLLLVALPGLAQPVEIVHGFDGPPALTAAGLVEGPGGVLYGTSLGGGAFGMGTVYAITASGDVTVLHSFTGGSDGSAPQGGLVWVGGYLYGTTSYNPPVYNGTVFRIPTAGPLETLFTFSGPDGSRPYASLTLGSDGWLYGTTIYGGTAGSGTLFRIRPDGTGQEVLHSFGGPGEGQRPWAAVVEGEAGVFYGTTAYGGASAKGTIYKWSAADGLITLLSFGPPDGSYPQSQLYKDANGTFWGTTSGGGTMGYGTVFNWAAPSGPVVTVHSFDGSAPDKYPASGLVPGPDGALWGTTAGDYTSGATVYRIDPGTGSYSVVHAFMPGPVYALGLLLAASDGRIYGTNEGASGKVERGSVFSVDPAAGNSFATVRAFGLAEDGWEPQSLAASDDGTLYGTTHYGGGDGLGTAFRIAADGSFETIHAFDDSDSQGGIPSSTRVIVASDGVLYGTRSAGGANGGGSVFAMTPAGSRTNLVDFSTAYTEPRTPSAALLEGTDGALYGTTVYGGAAGWGTVFKITKAGALTTLGTFTGVANGSEPLGRLVEGSDGRLYGTAYLNGIDFYGSAGWGTLFSTAKTVPSGILVVHQFHNALGGYSPEAGLIEAGPLRFFGSGRGGAFGNGVLFENDVNSSQSSYRVIHDFAGGPDDGAGVSKELVRGTDGFLYGTTYVGGVSNQGIVFRIRPDATGYEVVHRFTGDDGSRADGLTPGPDGNLYGITQMGGPNGGGVVFRVRLTPVVDAGGPYSVDEGGSIDVSATCNRPATFEWDFDGDGTFEDTGQTVTLVMPTWDGPSTHTIRVRATDDGGLSAIATATVNVANVVPTVHAGPDVALVAGESLAQAGSFTDPGPDTWTATVDYGDGSGSRSLALVGTSFNLSRPYPTAGTYTVRVSVTDDDGGVGTGTLVVQVSTVQDSIEGLISDVQGLVDSGVLNGGQGNSLISKLQAALKQLGKGNVTTVINQLEAFINEVTSDIQSGKLTPEEGQPLIDAANRVIAALS
jgi:uncharacterized repeat protein (TIGR03803 family)